MHKRDLIQSLRSKVLKIDSSVNGHNDHQWWRGQRTFAQFLIKYLENLNIPQDEQYDFWTIEHHLPELMVDAFEKLRTGDDEKTVRFRKMYEDETGHEVPNITDLGASNILNQQFAVQTTLGFMLKEVIGFDWLESKIDAYCNAQQHVLQQTFDKFLRKVYRHGLYEIADKCRKRGMSGTFGETELRTYIIAGRIMFTFVRRKEGETVFKDEEGEEMYRLSYQEDSVSFVGEDGDPLCLSAGIQSVVTDFKTALDMIEDVVRFWPATEKEREQIYKASDNVSLMF